MDLETQYDGQIKVSLTQYGVTASCYVSSMHLVEEKKEQLERAIQRQLELRAQRNGYDPDD